MLHCGVMSNAAIQEKLANTKADQWAERITAQRRSGMSVKQFCTGEGLTVRLGGTERTAAGANGRASAGTGIADRRAAAH
jgi:hypothetical protein